MWRIHTLKDLVRIYYTYRKEAHIAFASFILALVLGLLVIPPRYTSEARLLVKPGRENIVPIELADRPSMGVQNPQRDYMLDEIDMLQSPDLIAAVTDKYMELEKPRPRPGFWGGIHDAADHVGNLIVAIAGDGLVALGIRDRTTPEARLSRMLAQRFSVDYVKGSGVLGVSFTWADPKVAQDVLAAWIDLYLKHRVPVLANDDLLAFFAQQTRTAGQTLAAKEDVFATLQKRVGSFDLARREADLNQRLGELQKQRDSLERDYRSAAATLGDAEKRLGESKSFVTKETVSSENPTHRDLENRLYNERMQRQVELQTYSPDSEPVKHIEASISQIEQWLAQQTPTATQSETKEANPLRDDLAKEIQTTGLHLVEVTTALQALDKQIKDVGAERDQVIDAGVQFDTLNRDVDTAKQAYLEDVRDLERARKDRMQDLSRISNIAVVQHPTFNAPRSFPPTGELLLASPLLGGMFASMVLYILAVSDRRVRDQQNFATQLGIPLLAIIPEFNEHNAADRISSAEAMAALHYLQPRLLRSGSTDQPVRIGFVGLDPDDGLREFVSALRMLYDNDARAEAHAAASEAQPAPSQNNVVLIDSPPLRQGRASIDALGTTDSIVFVVEWGRATVPRVRHALELLRSIFADRLIGIVINRKRMVIPPALYRLLQ